MDEVLADLQTAYSVYRESYAKGQVVFTDRSRMGEELLILKGNLLEVFSGGEREKESSTLLYREGDFIGPFGQSGIKVSPTRGIARTDLEVVKFPEDAFFRVLDKDRTLEKTFCQNLCQLFLRMQKKYCGLALLSPSQRIVDFLYRLGKDAPDGKILLTTESITVAMSTTRQTVSKVLNALKRRKLIQSSYKSVRVLDGEGMLAFYEVCEER